MKKITTISRFCRTFGLRMRYGSVTTLVVDSSEFERVLKTVDPGDRPEFVRVKGYSELKKVKIGSNYYANAPEELESDSGVTLNGGDK